MVARETVTGNGNVAREEAPERPFAGLRMDVTRLGWCAAAGIVVGLGLSMSPLAGEFQHRVDHPGAYQTRNLLGFGATLARNLKIVEFDDNALIFTGAAEPTLRQLADVITLVARQKPAAIVINKVFSVPPVGSEPSEVSEFVRSVRSVHEAQGVPVIAAAYFQPAFISDRPDLRYHLQTLPPGNSIVDGISMSSWGLDRDIPLKAQLESRGYPANHIDDTAGEFLFGPAESLLPAFSGLGVVNYSPSGKVQFLMSAGNKLALPHIAVAVFPQRTPRDGFMEVSGRSVPVNQRGEFLLDWVPRQDITRQSVSMKHLLNPKTRTDAASRTIAPGDIVVVGLGGISGNLFQGRILTPMGWMRDIHVTTSVLSNLIGGRFVRESRWPEVWVLPAVAGAIILAASLSPGLALGAVIGFCGLWFAATALVFAWLGLAIPASIPCFAALVSGGLLASRNAAAAHAAAIKIAAAFDGRVTNKALEQMARNPQKLQVGAREVPVSIMFLDIAGFSLFAERRDPQEVFSYLREFIREASGIVHEYGGVVDKSLGDGLLAYFGYDLENPGDQLDHANRAFDCAVRIQEAQLIRNQRALGDNQAVLPVRVGVHSATCLLGDLGTEKRMDVTIVGGGVNFAKRLEDACDPGAILISATTATLASRRGRNSALARKFVRVKHMNALVEAYEYDPLVLTPHLKVKLLEAFRATVALDRVDRRWVVPDGRRIILSSELGQCEMVNFSGRGFAASLPAGFSRGSRFTFEVVEADGPSGGNRLLEELRSAGIKLIDAEVRWGHSGADARVIHGFSIHGFSEEQSAAFNRALLDFCFADEEFKLPRIG